jgi:hypothetical protein
MNYGLRLNKNTAYAVFLLVELNLIAFYHRADAFGAKGFLNSLAVFNHSNLLKIGFERPVSCPQRETAVVTKGRCFSTGIALSHFLSPFPYINCKNE